MLAPLKVKVPLPCLVKPPVPLTTPANSVLLASPVVSVLMPTLTVVPYTPVNEPSVCDALSVKFAPEVLRFTAPVLAMALPPANTNEPALTVVAPE